MPAKEAFVHSLSLSRFFLALLLWLCMEAMPPWWPGVLTCIMLAGITDFLDGYLARRWNVQSSLGAFLDPLADKVFGFFAALAFVTKGLWPASLLWGMVVRDAVIVVGYGLLRQKGLMQRAQPLWLGKCFLTMLLFLMACSVGKQLFPGVLLWKLLFPCSLWFVWGGLVLSGAAYVNRGWSLWQKNKKYRTD